MVRGLRQLLGRNTNDEAADTSPDEETTPALRREALRLLVHNRQVKSDKSDSLTRLLDSRSREEYYALRDEYERMDDEDDCPVRLLGTGGVAKPLITDFREARRRLEQYESERQDE